MFNLRQVSRAVVFVLLLSLFIAAHASFAYGQNFALTPSAFSPPAGVDPGGIATATIILNTPDNYSGLVTLNCTVTIDQVVTNAVQCLISPDSATPAATLSLTVTAASQSGTPALPGQYTITVTGASGSETETAPLFLNVVNVQQDYIVSVSTKINPGTVTAGNGAQATITVTPIASYTGTVTLSCLSVTPTVEAAPYCSFQPATVIVGSGAAPTSVLTINTYGTVQNSAELWSPHAFYALWLGVPGLALLGVGAGGMRGKKLLGLLLLLAVAGGLLLLPSCGGITRTSNNNLGLITPNNTYMFTLTGVDENGVLPSNSTSNTDQATVSLTVN